MNLCHQKMTLSDLLTKPLKEECKTCTVGRMKENCQKQATGYELIKEKE
jgi:hypothetical protein